MITGKKSLDNLHDCVKLAFYKGSDRGYEFKKMRHSIIVDLKRLGYSISAIRDKLQEWNGRCEKPLSPMEQKRQLFDYFDWVNKQEKCGIGCKSLEDFCVGKDKCDFNKRKLLVNRDVTRQLPFDLDEASRFLEKRYRAEGYVMLLILKNLRRHQISNGTGEVILVGLRSIAAMVRDNDGHNIDIMTISRRIQDLVSEGLLEIAIKGKKGSFTQESNGYRFLVWETPQYDPK
jgi:hypothetical protein